MKNLFNAQDAIELQHRLQKLTPTAQPKWGRLTATTVLCHLADPLRVALGEKTAEPLRAPLRLPGISHAVVWVLPWPKGAPTAPEFLPGGGMTEATTFAGDKRALEEVLQKFCRTPSDAALQPNPVFGKLSRRAWGRLMWRHLNHHLQQFGL